MPKWNEFSKKTDPAGIELVGLQEGQNIRIDADKVGGGEVWENVPFEFFNSLKTTYIVSVNTADILKSFIRVTIQHYSPSVGVFFMEQGAIISPIFKVNTEGSNIDTVRVVTNSIISNGFFGYIQAGSGPPNTTMVQYVYGVEIENEIDRPKILKVERLVENE